MIARRRTQRRRADAFALWLEAMRIAEQLGDLELQSDPALARRRRWENDRRQKPASAAAHVLMAPSLAELTAASTQDGAVDLGEMQAATEVPNQHTLLALAGCLAYGGSCELTLDELLELDDTDLRYALEGIALHRRLWPVSGDLRWLQAAQALHAASGGSDDRR